MIGAILVAFTVPMVLVFLWRAASVPMRAPEMVEGENGGN